MGRQRLDRVCSFKPNYTLFEPKKRANGEIEINSDELEAIYLMDYEDLYQEEAALQMEVSRPTFSRILKSARTKIATALIRGYSLKIIDEKDKFVVAFSTPLEKNGKEISNMHITHEKIALVHLFNQKVVEVKYIPNPLHASSLLAKDTLPSLLKSHCVSFWLSKHMKKDFENALLARGIFYKRVDSLKNLNELPKLFCKSGD
ncbi:MAG: DUF134 domain-containing protein [Sulfurospirillaceae bacterium]|nr:DUF134 domain-containing protein [Sulfurospirillaceae bacterium]